MALAVVATFLTLSEAQIAAGALRSGGVRAEVMDENYGSTMWTNQFALQGFRVAVSELDVADTLAFFDQLPKLRKRRAKSPTVSSLARESWRPAAALAAVGLGPLFGWLVVGLRPQSRRRGWVTYAGALTAVLVITMGAVFFALVFFLVERAADYPLTLLSAVGLIVLISWRQTQRPD